MQNQITFCAAFNCKSNSHGLCTAREISLDYNGTCEKKKIQKPLPEPSK